MNQEPGGEFQKRALSFRYAFSGWWYAVRTQRNTWIHGAATIAVILLAIWLRLSSLERAILVLAITIVWAVELINTAVEAVVDLVNPEEHELAKIAKDVAAAAVLVCACGAVLIGLFILGPPLLARLTA